MSAKRRLAVSVGGLWLCLGRLDQKKILARRGWFSVADVTRDFWNFRFLVVITAGPPPPCCTWHVRHVRGGPVVITRPDREIQPPKDPRAKIAPLARGWSLTQPQPPNLGGVGAWASLGVGGGKRKIPGVVFFFACLLS